MKKLLTAYLPALALFALGGCASTSGLASTEDDGVYYSSRDRTTAVVRSAPTTSANEAANPDYNGNTGTSSARQGSGSDEYYDNSYTYMQGVQPGVSYYTPYSPYTTLSYGTSSYYGGGFGGYGGGFGYGGYSPYGAGFYDPFYSPFYSPYGYGYGSGLTISFGFGRSFGYGSAFGYGRPYGGYGYGHGYGGFYDPYYYSGYYGGYYGRGGYYGNNYYGNNRGYYGNNNGYYGDNNGRGRNPGGHRNYRSSDGRYQSGNGAAGTVSGNNAGGGRIRPDGLLNPTQNQPTATDSRSAAMDAGRTRTEAVSNAPDAQRDRTRGSFNQPTSISGADQPRYRNMDQQGDSRQMTDAMRDVQRDTRPSGNVSDQPVRDQESRNRNNRWRSADNATQLDQSQPATAQPQENTRRRGGLFQSNGDQPRQESAPQQATEQQRRSYDQPRQERGFEQPQQQQQQRQPEQRQRSFEQPQQQRSFEQPQQRQRSFEQPQRSYSQPSFSSPSGGGGGGGGGGRSRGRGE